MDTPIFFIDGLGMPALMALTAVLHVLLNHPLAIGGYPLVTLFEWQAWRTKDPALDRLAYRMLFTFFIINTTVGALTGVGIWFVAGLIAPAGIGSLLRIFFWVWFAEWIVFILEIALLLAYVLSWKRATGERKRAHIRLGAALAVVTWLTMVFISTVLAFMLMPGHWEATGWQPPLFRDAVFNPLYLPQLVFRTGFAMVSGGLVVWLLAALFTERGELRWRVVRWASVWSLAWLPVLAAGAVWLWSAVPDAARSLAPLAVTTQAFAHWQGAVPYVLGAAFTSIVAAAAIGAWRPRALPAFALIVPLLFSSALLGQFERVREFIRKPYLISGYLYANGIRVEELPLLQREGLLRHATYARHREITAENRMEAGEDVFLLACSRCHTTRGFNGVLSRLERRLGRGPWSEGDVEAYIKDLHLRFPHMPPFPGTAEEQRALAGYLAALESESRRSSMPSGKTMAAGKPR